MQILLILLVASLVATTTLIIGCLKLLPQVEMTLKNKCKNRIHGWNGKIFNVQVWSSSFENRPAYFSIHYTGQGGEEDSSDIREIGDQVYDKPVVYSRNLRVDDTFTSIPNDYDVNSRPVIIWGSHHKTGTYLATKIFSVLCARANWCCIFHVTRDSVHAVQHSLRFEQPTVLGHSQWVWYPEELVPASTNYRFIHFYRDPIQKILSGYRYHRSGVETWTQKMKSYAKLCDSDVYKKSLQSTRQMMGDTSYTSKSIRREGNKRNDISSTLSSDHIYHHCKNTQLCIPCCRREHEYDLLSTRDHSMKRQSTASTSTSTWNQLLSKASPETLMKSNNNNNNNYMLRDKKEYEFICEHLGRVGNTSLSDAYNTVSAEEGLLTEASLSYYENLRMMRIVNHTWDDPYTLNVDIDQLNTNFESLIRDILTHIGYPLLSEDREKLVQELKFYDLEKSPIYRYSMTNSYVSHVDVSDKESRAKHGSVLSEIPQFQQVYSEIYSLKPTTSQIVLSRKNTQLHI